MIGRRGEKPSTKVEASFDTSNIYPQPSKGIGGTKHEETRQSKRPFVLLALAVAVLGAVTFAFVLANQPEKKDANTNQTPEPYAEEVEGINTWDLQHLSPDEVDDVYNRLQLPNTIDITSAPAITGDYGVDKHIQDIAVARGYKLRSIPRLPIVKTESDGEEEDLLQPLAYESWTKLRDEAKKSGLNFVMNSGYRSIEWQRTYFNIKLNELGVDTSQVESGSQNALLNQVMDVVAPPGYSKHHTGYTIDFACGSKNSFNFEKSNCWDWISADNFANAKKFNWVPSYPGGVEKVGPNPEAWEFVWFDLNQD